MLEEVRPKWTYSTAREVTGGEYGGVGVWYFRQREHVLKQRPYGVCVHV